MHLSLPLALRSLSRPNRRPIGAYCFRSRTTSDPRRGGRAISSSPSYVTNSIEAPCIIWDDAPVDVNADQAIAAASAAIKDGGALNDAKDFLRDLLADGPVDAKEGEEAARANGITDATLNRARNELGVESVKDWLQRRLAMEALGATKGINIKGDHTKGLNSEKMNAFG